MRILKSLLIGSNALFFDFSDRYFPAPVPSTRVDAKAAASRRWPAKVWSIVLTLSGFFVLWVGFAFKLIRMGADY